MAKKREEKFDLDDMDLDFDLDKELGDIDFGGSKAKPPKNKREAILNSGKDVYKGFMENVKDNKLATAAKLAEGAIPGSLRGEYYELASMYGDTKDIIVSKTDEIKKAAYEATKAVNRIVPENSKLNGLLKKIAAKLEKQQEPKGPSKEEIEKQKVQEGILGALGELKDKSHVDAMIQQAVASKQHATTAALLQNIYAETRLQRQFHYEITNKYYRKSLELQYKHLFTAREQLELMKAGFDTFKNQLETIITNTALPDLIKTQNSEFIKGEIGKRMRNNALDMFYKNFDPMRTMKKNLSRKVTNSMNQFIGGLRGSADMINQTKDASAIASESGMSKAHMAGTYLSDFGTNLLGEFIGNKFSNSKTGQKAIFNIKNKMADPRAILKELRDSTKGKKGMKNKGLNFLASSLFGLTGTPEDNATTYGRANLDDAHAFDGRAHTSITKIIPGLLSKIYGEIKANRVGGSGADHEIIFDNKSDRFMSKKDMIKDIKSDFQNSIKNNAAADINNITRVLKDAGVSISGSDKHVLGQALIGMMLQPGGGVSPSMLYDEAFLATIGDKKVANALRKGKVKLMSYLQQNPWEMDGLIFTLSNMKKGLPNATSRFKDIYASGHGDVLRTLGVANLNSNGNMTSNRKGLENLISSSYTPEVAGTANTISDAAIGMSSSIGGRRAAKRVANAINKGIGGASFVVAGAAAKTREALKFTDSENLVDYFASSKSKPIEFSEDAVGKKGSKLKEAKKIYNTTAKKIEQQMATTKDPQIRKKLQESLVKLKESPGSFLKTTTTEGFNEVAFSRFKKEANDVIKDSKRKPLGIAPSTMNNIAGAAMNAEAAGVGTSMSKVGETVQALQDPNQVYKMIGQGVKKMMQKPKEMDELRAEYFSSKEYQSGQAPSFLGWVNAMGYRVKGEQPLIKRILKKTREWDRQMAGFLLKSPFKAVGMLFGKKGRATQKNVAKGAAKMAGVALDMLPFGMGEIIKAPISLMNKTLELVGLKQSKEEAEKKKQNRKGSWLDRLNIFKKDKDINSKDGAKREKTLKDNIKKMGITALVGGAVLLLNKMGVTLGDVVNVVKNVFNAVVDVGKGLWKVGEFIGEKIGAVFDMLPNWMNPFGGKKKPKIDPATGEPIKDENGNIIYEEGGGAKEKLAAAGGVAAVAAGAYAARHPIKAVKGAVNATKAVVQAPGKVVDGVKNVSNAVKNTAQAGVDIKNPNKGFAKRLFDGFLNRLKNPPEGTGFIKRNASKALAWGIEKSKGLVDKIVKFIGKIFKSIVDIPKYFTRATKVATSPKVLKKVGASAAKKVAVKLGAYAASATGIGAILSAGMLIWDLGWIIWYMYDDNMTFMQAVLKQMLDIDPKDKDLNDEIDKIMSDADKEEEKQTQQEGAKAAEELKKAGEPVPGNSSSSTQASSSSSPSSSSGGEQPSMWQKFKSAVKSGTLATIDAAKSVGSAIYEGGKKLVGGVTNVAKGIYEKGKGWLAKKPLTDKDNKFPQYSPSPYIVPNKQTQTHPQGAPADVKGLTPDTQKRLIDFAKHYYDITGKPLYINAAKRTFDQQIKMWEKESKVKYTGNKEADMLAMCKAGGCCFGALKYYEKFNMVYINGKKNPNARNGLVGYPYAGNPHLGGRGIDIDLTKTPYNNEVKKDTKDRHWLFDDIMAKYGLHRPYTAFNKYPGSKERWHIVPTGSYSPPQDEPDTSSMVGAGGSDSKDYVKAVETETKKELAQDASTTGSASASYPATGGTLSSSPGSYVSSSATSSVASSNLASGGSSSSSSPSPAMPTATTSYSSDTTTLAASPTSSMGFSGGSIESVLSQQFDVQRKSMDILSEIRNILGGGSSGGSSPSASTMPNPLIDIKRKESFNSAVV